MFALYYYSFDFCCKSLFALLFLAVAADWLELPSFILTMFSPIALLYLVSCVAQSVSAEMAHHARESYGAVLHARRYYSSQ